MRRRYLALWFPLLPADRLARKVTRGCDLPTAFVEKQRGAMRIVALDRQALALGLTPGMMLADARARVPELAAVDDDPVADGQLLEQIADLCDRYTPMVALDWPDGITLDVTGAAHLFGGEGGMAEDAETRLTKAGMHLRHAFADTPEAAQALARFQSAPSADEAMAIRRLPIAALRLEEAAETALRRAGLKTVGDLAARPTGPLSSRFGEEASAALDQLLGRADSRIRPRRPAPALFFERRFADPIGRTEDALGVVADLAGEAAKELEARHGGGRRFVARLYRSDGAMRDLEVETSLPMRDPAALDRLFRERIDALADPLDPGFGFDMIRLAVPRIERMAPTQLRLEGGAISDDAMASLVDRLSVRLGRGRLRRFVPRDTHIPEQGMLALPAIEAPPADWAPPEPGEPPLRPLHLFDPPQPIDVIADVPDGPPHRFTWRRDTHVVMRSEGPERIAPEWWRRDDSVDATRDYYRVEDKSGRRFWIFRHGLYGAEQRPPGWYVHGLFA